ncbi:RES domain-containing protein [Butyrivibrio sp. XBB1001]|uniref:RES domain-containing protein n=1 Tax=Butyrivibrio sp. XBB1001 TaxID=1280682 RepID=UPI003FA468DD
MAEQWNYKSGLTSTEKCQEIGKLAREQHYDAIIFKSYRGPGKNYVIFDNFDEIVSPRIVTPIG